MKRAAGLVLALAVFACCFASCAPKSTAPPPPGVGPHVVAVQPPARSTGNIYDGQIWALFAGALDPASVDSTTVFLKQDTKRISSQISYEPVTKRIVVVPRSTLALQTAYTVILSSRVRSKDGVELGSDYTWQFVTSSLRRVVFERPAPDTLASPVAYLKWSSPESSPGTIVYEVYAGPDSVAVAARDVPYIYRGASGIYLPRAYWPAGVRTYWAVTTYHVQTGERLDSPVTSFLVYPADAPTQTLTMTVADWGGFQSGGRTQYCNATAINFGTGWSAGMHFPLGSYPSIINVAHVTVNMSRVNGSSPVTNAGIYATTAAWTACAANYPGPPFADPAGPLAMATSPNGIDMQFDSPALAAQVEAMKRSGSFTGFAFAMSSGQIGVATNALPQPTLTLTYYP